MFKLEQETRNPKYLLKDKVTLLSVEKSYSICNVYKYKSALLPKLILPLK